MGGGLAGSPSAGWPAVGNPDTPWMVGGGREVSYGAPPSPIKPAPSFVQPSTIRGLAVGLPTGQQPWGLLKQSGDESSPG